ncbi:uncharacterized protein TM35_000511420 [Trypanosoma theileri]|uniref:Mucin-associated surface protein (MASP) n=1 Tax=Trypanosoma theileri TaxID=67003 RepID=A0A1X0NHG9_9TRYP|nr:uncharacterized protein TM35_000511420 [Trypanosoma theileri]ORC84041.1 hypothetical protein TM35_000511420 [Trypanosoma theileri]
MVLLYRVLILLALLMSFATVFTMAEDVESRVEDREPTLLNSEESRCVGDDALGSSGTACSSVPLPLAQPQAEPRGQGKSVGGVPDPQGSLSEAGKHLGGIGPSVGVTPALAGPSGSHDPSTVSLSESQSGSGRSGQGGHVHPSSVDQDAPSRDSQTLKDSSRDLQHQETEAVQNKEIPNLDPERKEGPHKPAENEPGRGDPVQPTKEKDSKQSLHPAQASAGSVTPTSPTTEELVGVPTAEGERGDNGNIAGVESETATQPSADSPNTSAAGSSGVSDAPTNENNTSSAESESTNNQNEEGVTGNKDTTTTTTTATTTLPPETANNKKGDADSSSSMSSSVWVRVPLLIVVTLACILVC